MIIVQKLGSFLLKGLSHIPLPFLYGIATLLYGVSYHLLGYRKKVVRENLAHAFPEYDEAKRRQIEKHFYQNLSNWVVEIIKSPGFSASALQKRCSVKENDALRELRDNPQSAIVLTAHLGNWEWAGQKMGLYLEQPLSVVYKPLTNPMINQVMQDIRTHFGNETVSMTHVMRRMHQGTNRNLVSSFLADQSPKTSDAGYWRDFLNRTAPFFNGPEKIAKKLNLPVFFGQIKMLKKGYYEIEFQLITKNAAQTQPNEITDAYITHLERAIREQPENWLWSHRRWKREKKGPKAS